MPPNDKKVSAEDTKMTAEKMAFNNAAVEAIQKNAAERDALRKKNKDVANAARAKRQANRASSGSGGSLKGLSVLGGAFAGTSGVK
jgi:hypothetical protein